MAHDPVQVIAAQLERTQVPDKATRAAAEAELTALSATPNFRLHLLTVCDTFHDNLAISQGAALWFKNHVRKHWVVEDPELLPDDERAIAIGDEERDTIKTHIVDLMCRASPSVQRPISDALTIISESDFPDKWPGLMPDLVMRLGASEDFAVINGLLSCAKSIFKRFANTEDNDEIRRPLKYCLEQFQEPLLLMFTKLSALMDTHGAEQATAAALATSLTLMLNIFFSLSWIDLPEYFEDHLSEWMTHHLKYLEYANPLLEDADEEDEPGPLERLRTAVLANLNLYAEKHDEEFEPFFPTFVSKVWEQLEATDAKPKYDLLVTTSIKFLVSVVGKAMHRELFKEMSTLTTIVEKIVIPNLVLRESDEELFEDNPVEFLMRDIEGSDNDTRRRTAADLVREMAKTFQKEVTDLCSGFIGTMLGAYAADPAANWKQKDAAVALVIALTVKSSTRERGVSSTNELVDLGEFFTSHVLPELSAADIDTLPILKSASIKFVSTFRNQLPREVLLSLIPVLSRFLKSGFYVTHTYAAACLERILTVRVGEPGRGPRPLAVTPEDLGPIVHELFEGLFALMMRPDYPENEYLMKCAMRLVSVGKAAVVPHIDTILASLKDILMRVCANPARPNFNHFLFETLAVLTRNVCSASPESVAAFETNLFPPFQRVLELGVDEFLPYVFQVLAQLLSFVPTPDAGVSALSEAYVSLFPPLLAADVWTQRGNVPALSALMCVYLRKGAAHIVANNHLIPVLGIFQKLVSLRATEDDGFSLLRAILTCVPQHTLDAYIGEIGKIIFLRSQKNGTTKFYRHMIVFLGLCGGLFGGEATMTAVTWVAPFLKQVFVSDGNKVLGDWERRVVQIGLTRLLCEAPGMLSDPATAPTWGQSLGKIVEMIESREDDSVPKEEEEADLALEQVNAGYSNAFARLAFADIEEPDPFADLGDARAVLVQQLSALGAAHPGLLGPVLGAHLVPAASEALAGYFAAAGVAAPA